MQWHGVSDSLQFIYENIEGSGVTREDKLYVGDSENTDWLDTGKILSFA